MPLSTLAKLSKHYLFHVFLNFPLCIWMHMSTLHTSTSEKCRGPLDCAEGFHLKHHWKIHPQTAATWKDIVTSDAGRKPVKWHLTIPKFLEQNCEHSWTSPMPKMLGIIRPPFEHPNHGKLASKHLESIMESVIECLVCSSLSQL